MTVAVRGLDPCVHCGFCLQSCPTYLVTGDEADSPRGRIVLMRALAGGRLTPSDEAATLHLDRCLGCRACEPVCPSGVEYGAALEDTRAFLAEHRPIHPLVRLVHQVMADDTLRRPTLTAARLARPMARWFAGPTRIGFAAGMLAATRPAHGTRITPGKPRNPGRGEREGIGDPPISRSADPPIATVFTGCIMDGLFGHVHRATERALQVNGYDLMPVTEQGCCGALHAHAGQRAAARELARRNVRAFRALSKDATIVVNAAGCSAMLKQYPELLHDDPLHDEARRLAARVRDVSEALADRGLRRGAGLPLRVAYDPPCHLLHAQRIARPPLDLLAAIPDLERVPHADADLCCGSAGSYTLAQPGLSHRVLDRKLDALQTACVDVVVTGNPGCQMQVGAGLLVRGDRTPVRHPVELLDDSYRLAGFYDA
jgi:glycolate oxidase iron-sulfur subunit